MNWLRGFWESSKYTLRSSTKIGFWPRKISKASTRSGRWASMVGGRYAPMIGVRDVPLTTSKLTMSSLWKRVDSRLHTIGCYRETRSTPPCAPPALAGRAVEQKMLYPRQFQKYTIVDILILVMTMRLKPPSLKTWTSCTNPKLLPSRMLSVLMTRMSGPGTRRSGGGIDEWIRSVPCSIGRLKKIGILDMVCFPQKYAPYCPT